MREDLDVEGMAKVIGVNTGLLGEGRGAVVQNAAREGVRKHSDSGDEVLEMGDSVLLAQERFVGVPLFTRYVGCCRRSGEGDWRARGLLFQLQQL